MEKQNILCKKSCLTLIKIENLTRINQKGAKNVISQVNYCNNYNGDYNWVRRKRGERMYYADIYRVMIAKSVLFIR